MTEYGLAGQPKPEGPEIIEDLGYNITFAGTDETYVFTERWDSLHRFTKLGAWCIKIFDNDNGLVEAWLNDEAAEQVIEHTGTEVRYRDKITQEEYNAYLRSKGLE
jgi:hypothetical protein